MLVNKKKLDEQTGQAALPAILLISGVIIEIAIAGALIAFILSNSGWGERLSAQAFLAAKAGVEDAFVRITADKTFSSADGYTFSIDSGIAVVTVEKNVDGTDKITSLGKALTRRRKLEAIVAVNADTGKVDLKSITEIE